LAKTAAPWKEQSMRILGVGESCDLGDMYLRLSAEGHELRVFARATEEHGTMRGMLTHVSDYRAELDWVRAAGDEGLIVFETAEHGSEQDALRRDGFYVIGGSAFGDRLENERAFGQAALSAAGLRAIPTHEFSDFEQAIAFVKQRPRRYVFKLNGSSASSWRNFVGQSEDGRDLVALLGTQRARLQKVGLSRASFVLVDYVAGVETGIGAYFDGESFLTPACLDWEHKRFFPGDIGELTGEMGTLVTYRDSERLFSQTLAKLAPQLREGGYVGYINLNTIINEQGVWPLELTCRFGYPGYAILDALQCDGWASLFRTLRARGGHFRTRSGYAVGVVLTVPPYPYRYGYADISRGLPIVLSDALSGEEREQLHFAEVDAQDGQLLTSGVIGYTMVATGVGESVHLAQQRAYALAEQVFVPNLRYRNDIGNQFRDTGQAALRAWGYLP
jgi:phosphoribosylamine--glycine ligase